MNVADLAERIAVEHDLSKGQAKEIVAGVLAVIAAAASAGEDVTLSGFGSFKVVNRAARRGRNPATGETIQIAASKKLTFSAAKNVRDGLNAAKPAGHGRQHAASKKPARIRA